MPRYKNPALVPVSLTSGRVLDVGEIFEDDDLDLKVEDARIIQVPDREPYTHWPIDELEKEVDARGLEIAGTGKDGNVVKADMVTALEAHDEASKAAQYPLSTTTEEGGA